jgi:hypothetical protein
MVFESSRLYGYVLDGEREKCVPIVGCMVDGGYGDDYFVNVRGRWSAH